MGRVTHASDRVRVIVQFFDVADERHLWGDCYDGEACDVLTLQDRVVGGVLCAIQPSILGDHIERARRGDPATLSGLDIALRSLPDALSWNRSERAVDPLCQAMMLDPDCALAAALAGWCHVRRATPWNSKAVEERTLGNRLADRAGLLAPADPMVLAMRASVAHLAREYAAADALAARAIARDPTCAWAWDRRGWVHEAIERPDDALPFFARVEGIPAPYLDGAESLNGVGTAHFCAGRYREAVVALRKAALVRSGSGALHGQLAACYVQLGDRAAARAELDILRRVLPDVSATQYVDGYPCGFASFKDALANSLTEIGMPA
jgi:adenylate cyclase